MIFIKCSDAFSRVAKDHPASSCKIFRKVLISKRLKKQTFILSDSLGTEKITYKSCNTHGNSTPKANPQYAF